jgi:hypothetical protein
VNAGSSGTHGPITIASQDGFTGTVTLSCPTTYGAGSCSVTPASVNSYPATATLTINGTSFVAGAYSLTITGTSGSVIHTLAVPFNVGDYAISGTETLLATPGSQASASLTLTSSNAYGGKINATCDATALAGSMCTLTPANPVTVASGGGTNLTATINISKDAPPGVYSIKITTRDTTGAPSHSANVALTVAQDFVLSSSTPSQTVKPGQTSGAYNLRVQPVGSSFTGAVTLACTTGLPAGAQCNFSPSTAVTPGTSAVDIVMNISTMANRADAHRSSANSPPAHRWLFYAVWFLLPGVVVGSGASRRQRDRRKMHSFAGTTLMFLTMLAFAACSGVSSGGGGGTPPPPVTYHVTIAGSSPGTAVDAGHSVVVNLVVQ